MNAEQRTINKVLTEQICYEIPPYQRPYSWQTEHTEQLLQDILDAYERKDEEYFIGSLITIERERDRLYDVVDGQQRLTTLNLIFARIRDRVENTSVKDDLGNRIRPQNAYTGEKAKPRLMLRAKERSFFNRHVLESQPVTEQLQTLEEPQRRLTENMAVVDTFIKDMDDITLRLFANFVLTKVYVVFVNTESKKSAYRLFNVMNARGLSLSNADLIKNSLFGKLETEKGKEEELEEHWIELEETLGIDVLDAFLGHLRTSMTASKARGSLFEEFEPIIENEVKDPIEFLDKLISSAKNYTRIVELDFENTAALRIINALHRVDYDEWIAPLLAFLDKPVDGMEETEFLQLLEKITMQNWIRRLGRSKRLTVYFQLINAILKRQAADDIRTVFRKNANNEELITLLQGDIYTQPSAKAVLLRLEDAFQDESVTKMYGNHISIEHVLPQSLKDPYWQKRFTEETHKRWVHKLGNLMLLAGNKNTSAQYYDFPKKKAVYERRNQKVSFDLSKEVCQIADWTQEVIEDRQKRLTQMATSLWKIE